MLSVSSFYTKRVPCAICQSRRPKRFCPGVGGDICSVCCGTERESTVTCPFECEYLQDARKHEKPAALDSNTLPNRDIRVTEKLIQEHGELITFLAAVWFEAASTTPGVCDYDVRDALDALIRTYRTLQAGLYYETRAVNAVAQQLNSFVQKGLEQFRKEEQHMSGLPKTRDSDVLALLVFFQHLELDRNNGRRRGRAFIDLLRRLAQPTPGESLEAPASALVQL